MMERRTFMAMIGGGLLAASLVEDGWDRPRLRQDGGARERWAGGYCREP